MGKLDGKVALVTGAARGQGEAEARLFAEEGAQVVLTDLLEDAGRAVAADIDGTFLVHDVASEAAWAAVVQQTLEQHHRIDVLVNNAGVFLGAGLLNTSMEDYRRVTEINQTGVFLGMRAVVPQMIEQQGGSIINISSVAGFLGAANAFAYGASKWAVRGMSKAAGVELARYGIRVNSIHPGMIDTDMMAGVTRGDERRHEKLMRGIPLRRAAAASEVAAMALFLASDDSSYCTASEFLVDGGVAAL